MGGKSSHVDCIHSHCIHWRSCRHCIAETRHTWARVASGLICSEPGTAPGPQQTHGEPWILQPASFSRSLNISGWPWWCDREALCLLGNTLSASLQVGSLMGWGPCFLESLANRHVLLSLLTLAAAVAIEMQEQPAPVSLTSCACVSCPVVELGGRGKQGARSSVLVPRVVRHVQAQWGWSVWFFGGDESQCNVAGSVGKSWGRVCNWRQAVGEAVQRSTTCFLGSTASPRREATQGPLGPGVLCERVLTRKWFRPRSGSLHLSGFHQPVGSVTLHCPISWAALCCFPFRCTPDLHPQNFSLPLGSLWISSVQT